MASRLAAPAPLRAPRSAPPPPSAPEARPTEGLLAVSLAATACLLALPGLTVALLVRVAGVPLSGPAGWAATAAASLACMFAGSKLWSRHPGSKRLTFGELVLWSWARRRHAEGTLKRSAGLLEDEIDHYLNPQGRRAQVKVLRELNAALEVRDPYTRGHAKRVERHAHRIALALRCSDDDIFDIRLAASLHDVGKIKVPDAILRKDGPLDAGEWAIMQEHSAVGADLVKRLGNETVVAAVRHHHERWDGRGYPNGVSGTAIPLGARIIAVADTFDAITSCRPYRNRSDRAHAISVLKSEAGRQFDPAVVTAFLSTTPHQAAAFAGIATLIAPLARKLSSQWGVLFNKVGAASLAGTMTASAFTGVAAVEGPLAKGRDRGRPARATAPVVPGTSDEAGAIEGAPETGDGNGRSATAPSPEGNAFGHSKKAHEGGNGKSRAGGNGKSHAGGNGKSQADEKTKEKGPKDKSKPHKGGNGKSQGAAHAAAASKHADPTKAKDKTKAEPAGAPAVDAPAPEVAAPAPSKPAKPAKPADPAEEAPAEAPVVEEPVEAAPEPPAPDQGKAKGKTK